MESFRELYERYYPDVYRFALFLTANPAIAEDLAADTFVRAWTSRGRIRQATVKGYLLAITRNLHRDALRRRRPTVPKTTALEGSLIKSLMPAASSPALPGLTKIPDRPCDTTSGIPPTRVAMTERFSARASNKTIGIPS